MQEPLTRSLDLHQGSGVHLPQGGSAKRLSPLAAGLAIESQMTKSWMPKCLFPDNDRRGCAPMTRLALAALAVLLANSSTSAQREIREAFCSQAPNACREVFCSRANNACIAMCPLVAQTNENCETKCGNRRASCQKTGCYYFDRIGAKCDGYLVRQIDLGP